MEQLTARVNSNLNNRKVADAFKDLFSFAINNNLAIAIWRHPQQEEKHLIIDISGEVNYVKPDLEALTDGFMLSPFADNGSENNIFIQNHIYFGSKSKELNVSPFLSSKDNMGKNIEKYMQLLDIAFVNEFSHAKGYYSGNFNKSDGDDKNQYLNVVKSAIAEINVGKFDKVVPSRTKTVALKENFDVINTFDALCEAYDNALISVVAVPGLGTWIGATPEELISLDKNKVFTTVALAGTQETNKDSNLYDVAWRQKEIEEQAMVSRYIINCFKKIRLREFDEHGPRTARAGSMAHLKTDFVVDTIATNFPQLATVMLELLHPTSAVCGMPKAPAQAFLKKHEVHDRSFFSGYLGPVNMFDETHLFVNIRCMQLARQEARLYAGAGVTAISNPEKEWEETNLKFQTMLRVL